MQDALRALPLLVVCRTPAALANFQNAGAGLPILLTTADQAGSDRSRRPARCGAATAAPWPCSARNGVEIRPHGPVQSTPPSLQRSAPAKSASPASSSSCTSGSSRRRQHEIRNLCCAGFGAICMVALPGEPCSARGRLASASPICRAIGLLPAYVVTRPPGVDESGGSGTSPRAFLANPHDRPVSDRPASRPCLVCSSGDGNSPVPGRDDGSRAQALVRRGGFRSEPFTSTSSALLGDCALGATALFTMAPVLPRMRPYGVTLTFFDRWPTPALLIAFTRYTYLTPAVTPVSV